MHCVLFCVFENVTVLILTSVGLTYGREKNISHRKCIITINFTVSLPSLEHYIISGVWYISVVTGSAVGETTR